MGQFSLSEMVETDFNVSVQVVLALMVADGCNMFVKVVELTCIWMHITDAIVKFVQLKCQKLDFELHCGS